MSKVMYSLTGSMLALSAFHGTQGMDVQKSLPSNIKKELTKTVQEFKSVRINKDKYQEKLSSVLSELNEFFEGYAHYYPRNFASLEQEREEVLYTLVQGLIVDGYTQDKFEEVLNELDQYGKKSYDEETVLIKEKRDAALRMICENIKIARQEEQLARQEEQRNRDTFKTVLCELQGQKVLEEKQESEMSEGLSEFFFREFTLAQEEKEQNAAFEKLSQSLVFAESTLDEEQLLNAIEKKAESVTVGRWTRLRDWWYGPSNLVDELKSDISLEVLKESPDMQARVNGIIAKCSPGKNRDARMLDHLLNIYTPLNQLNFKFVDADVNSDIHNTCAQWQRDVEAEYYKVRTARIYAIAQLLVQEMRKLEDEQAPREAVVEKLEKIKELSKQTGMVEEIQEGSCINQKNIPSTKIFDMVCRLGELSVKVSEEEDRK